jgi:hypothetical protein
MTRSSSPARKAATERLPPELPPELAPEAPASLKALTDFLARVDAFCAATDKRRGPVSSALFGHAGKIDRLHGEKDVGVKVLARAEAELARLAAAAGVALDGATGAKVRSLSAKPESVSRGERQ